jgi:hypothetical protein
MRTVELVQVVRKGGKKEEDSQPLLGVRKARHSTGGVRTTGCNMVYSWSKRVNVSKQTAVYST